MYFFLFLLAENRLNRKEFESYVEKALVEWAAPGVAVAVIDGDDLYYIVKGVRREGEDAPITEDTRFQAASMTKSVTATLAAKFVDLGLLSWSDPLKRYIPQLQLSDTKATEMLTILDVLSHRTGYPPFVDETFLKLGFSREDIWKIIKTIPMKTEPGKAYAYQNAFYGLMDEVFSTITHKSLQQLAEAYLFKPLDMKTASYLPPYSMPWFSGCQPHKRLPKDVAYPHHRHQVLPPSEQFYIHPASMGLTLSIKDAAKFLSFHMHGRPKILSAQQMQALRTPYSFYTPNTDRMQFPPERMSKFGYGMGWFQATYGTTQKSTEIYFHMGSWSGARSYIVFSPKHNVGLVVLSNMGSFSESFLPEGLAFTFLDKVIGLPFVDWSHRLYEEMETNRNLYAKEIQQERYLSIAAKEPLENLVGRYENESYGIMDIVMTQGGLQLGYRNRWVPLIQRAGTTFDFDPSGLSMAFSQREFAHIQLGYTPYGPQQRVLSCSIMSRGVNPLFVKVS